MPVVYVSPDTLRRDTTLFHKSLECRQLTKRPARGTKQKPVEFDLREIPHPRPCRTCYPDAPVPRSVHRICTICNTDVSGPKPCLHNGGVLIYETRRHRPDRILVGPEDTYIHKRYVWPELVHNYV